MGEYDPFDPNADQTKKGWLTAILELGAWIGTLMSGFIAETLSRKYGVLVAVTVFVIGVVVQATAQTGGHNAILGGRFVTGMGVGALAAIVPIYNSEVAPPEVRGALVALQQLAITFGILISFWIDYGTNFIGGTTLGKQKDAAWLVPITLQLAPAVVLFFGMLFSTYTTKLTTFPYITPHYRASCPFYSLLSYVVFAVFGFPLHIMNNQITNMRLSSAILPTLANSP